VRYLLALAALALAACGPSPDQTGADEPGAPGPPPPSAAPRLFEPLSKTAEAFTGTLELTELPRPGPNATQRFNIVSGMGHTWEIESIDKATTTDKVGSTMWRTLMPNSSDVNIYAVNEEHIKPGTPNGGLCGDDKTAFLALAESESQTGEGELEIAAFTGAAWPPTADRDPPLCGTFGYIARK
jgi:hypothetical protein